MILFRALLGLFAKSARGNGGWGTGGLSLYLSLGQSRYSSGVMNEPKLLHKMVVTYVLS